MGNKRNKRVGMGMTPRTVVSAVAGREEVGSKANSAQDKAVETGGNLAENSVQNLDSEKAPSVPAEILESIGAVTPEDKRKLEEMMGKHPLMVVDRATGAIGVFTPGADHEDKTDAAALADFSATKFEPETGRRPSSQPTSIADIEQAMDEHRSVVIQPNGDVILGPTVGERSDGSFGLVVTIPEGMIEPIREQAASDGMTAEEWTSTRLGEYLESWWSAPKGR